MLSLPAFILISRIAWSINRYLNIVKRFVQISEQIIMNSLTERFKYLREQILGPKASKRKFAEFLGVHPSSSSKIRPSRIPTC